MAAPTRPVLRWHGGKWRLAPWIISHFPRHRIYVEPFGGAASVLLQKEPSISEIWNDLDGGVVNLFRVLREQPKALQRALDLTPYSRADYVSLYEKTDDPVESARRFVARSFMGQSSKGAVTKSGFDSRINPDGYFGRLNSLRAVGDEIPIIAERMAKVMRESVPAAIVLDRYDRDDALFYVDPPYLPEARNAKSKVYNHDLNQAGHEDLLDRLVRMRAMVIVSGYPSDLYESRLSEWQRKSIKGYADGGRESEEVLWLNPACSAALSDHAGGAGMPLFAGAAS